MLLARMSTLRPTIEKKHEILETKDRIQSQKRRASRSETAERWLERPACLGVQDQRRANAITHYAYAEWLRRYLFSRCCENLTASSEPRVARSFAFLAKGWEILDRLFLRRGR